MQKHSPNQISTREHWKCHKWTKRVHLNKDQEQENDHFRKTNRTRSKVCNQGDLWYYAEKAQTDRSDRSRWQNKQSAKRAEYSQKPPARLHKITGLANANRCWWCRCLADWSWWDSCVLCLKRMSFLKRILGSCRMSVAFVWNDFVGVFHLSRVHLVLSSIEFVCKKNK